MAYTVEMAPSAVKELADLSQKAREAVKKKIESLKDNPRSKRCEKLTDEDGLYRIRTGDYRIIYRIRDKILVVLVVRISDRKDSYRNIDHL